MPDLFMYMIRYRLQTHTYIMTIIHAYVLSSPPDWPSLIVRHFVLDRHSAMQQGCTTQTMTMNYAVGKRGQWARSAWNLARLSLASLFIF